MISDNAVTMLPYTIPEIEGDTVGPEVVGETVGDAVGGVRQVR